jgi:DNA-binding transcriptional LysR family regulator
MTSQEVMRKVQEGSGSIGFVVDQEEANEVISHRVFTDRLHLVCSQKFYSGDTITMEELKKKPLITLVERFSPRRILEKNLKVQGESLEDFNILMNLDSTESVKASVIANLGFAFLPYMAIKKELYLKQLKIVEVEGFSMDYPLFMVHKEGSDFQNVPLDVIRYFEKVVNETFC